jgi:type I restriction enzyme R subunit
VPDLYEVKQDTQKQKTSILDDIDFELELIHPELAYILKLAQLKGEKRSYSSCKRKTIIDLLGGDIS